MMAGSTLFARFAYPPNSLGYCGPSDPALLAEMFGAPSLAVADFRQAIEAFAGAWPYLELIGGCTGRDPLHPAVVEAYWLGNGLLDEIDVLTWGNSLDDRFRARAGSDWDRIVSGINDGGVPSHAFHVFCAYPWVGLLRSGAVAQALVVLDRCRIRWGKVVGVIDGGLLVNSQPLEWDGAALRLGAERVEIVQPSVDTTTKPQIGDLVALHWDYVCQTISTGQLANLRANHNKHLAMANTHRAGLGSRIET